MRHLFADADFRRLFLGRLVTNAGDSLYFVAATWLVYDLSGSEFLAGLALFLVMAPTALQFLVGPLVDRWPLRLTLVATQLALAVLVLAVPVAALLGVLSAWLVLAVMPVLSLLNQFVYPAGTAALPRIVADEDLADANAAFSLSYQGVDAVFTGLAGALVALFGGVALYVVDSVTFAVAALLFAGLAVSVGPRPTDGDDGGYLADLRDGLSYVRRTVIVWVVGGSVVVNLLFGATLAAMPAYGAARGGAGAYGLFMAAIAAGSLAGALLAARFQSVPYGRVFVGGGAVAGVAWLVGTQLPWTTATAAAFALAFVPVGVVDVVFVTLVQRAVPERLLGRVTAVAASGSGVAAPVGALAGGALAEVVGAPPLMLAAGVGFLLVAGVALLVPVLREMPAPSEVETLELAGPANAD